MEKRRRREEWSKRRVSFQVRLWCGHANRSSGFLILLAGPRVSRMEPFSHRGYRTVACDTGGTALSTLNTTPVHAILFELDLDDVSVRDFISTAQQIQPDATYVIVEDARKSGMIIAACSYIVDAYIPTPPDPTRMFLSLERHLKAAQNRGGTEIASLQEARRCGERARCSSR